MSYGYIELVVAPSGFITQKIKFIFCGVFLGLYKL